MRRQVDDVQRQYAVSDPVKVRIETHRLYGERAIDLDVESARLLGLAGDENILDVGTDAQPIVQYVLSSLLSFELPDDQMSEMEHWSRTEAQRRLADLGDTWRDPTRVGFFVVSLPAQASWS